MFPVGIAPSSADPHRDERGLDTINRLLLHGARYHDRSALFVACADPKHDPATGGPEIPDWKADRLSIRTALVLQEDLSLELGDAVALWMPLSPTWAFVERGLWGVGVTSVPIPNDLGAAEVSRVLGKTRPKVLFVPGVSRASSVSIPDSIVAIVTLEESVDGGFGISIQELLERGGILDTPERASRYRASARAIPPETLASLELTSGRALRETTQGGWARDAERFAARFPPHRGDHHRLARLRVERAARLVLYAGWADGLTTVVLGHEARGTIEGREIVFGGESESGSVTTGFANLFRATGEENGGAM